MITWNNLDTLESYKELSNVKKVNLAEVMTGENGAERVKNYSVSMAAGLAYNYAAKQVDDDVLEALKKLAKEAQLTEKYAALYNGEVINTGEKRLGMYFMSGRYTSTSPSSILSVLTFSYALELYTTGMTSPLFFALTSASATCGTKCVAVTRLILLAHLS